jgi:hypothetical protein
MNWKELARGIVFVIIKCIALGACHQELDGRLGGALVGVVSHLVAFIALDGMNRQRLHQNFLFLIASCGGRCSHSFFGRFLSDVCEHDLVATRSDDL